MERCICTWLYNAARNQVYKELNLYMFHCHSQSAKLCSQLIHRYIKEQRYYDDVLTQSLKARRGRRTHQQKQQFSRWDQCSNATGCLCFCRRSKVTMDERVNGSFDLGE